VLSAAVLVIKLYQLNSMTAVCVGGANLLLLGAIALRYSTLNLSAFELLLLSVLIVVVLVIVLAGILVR
jgi:hypothetical protein